jgi:hypothetical protein
MVFGLLYDRYLIRQFDGEGDPSRLNYYALDGDHLWTLALVVSERLYPEASVHDHSVYNRGALLLCDTISPLLPAFWAR